MSWKRRESARADVELRERVARRSRPSHAYKPLSFQLFGDGKGHSLPWPGSLAFRALTCSLQGAKARGDGDAKGAAAAECVGRMA